MKAWAALEGSVALLTVWCDAELIWLVLVRRTRRSGKYSPLRGRDVRIE